jgi:CubicO group peptidase (beta-lactamase class C family)
VGKQYGYSNTNYRIAVRILERVSGKTFTELFQTEIQDRLKMLHSGMIKTTDEGSTTRFYNDQGIPFARNPLNYYGVGNIYSTAADLAKWQSFLFGEGKFGSFLGPEMLNEMITPLPQTDHSYYTVVPKDPSKSLTDIKNNSSRRAFLNQTTLQTAQSSYGLGVRVFKQDNKTVIWHAGHLTNRTFLVEHYLDDKITVIILTNVNQYDAFSMAGNITHTLFHLPTVPNRGQDVAKAALNLPSLSVDKLLYIYSHKPQAASAVLSTGALKGHKKHKRKGLVAHNE